MANDNDIARIGFVINNYDNIELISDADGNPIFDKEYHNSGTTYTKMIKMSKKINGTYYVIQAVPDTKSKTLYVVSAYIGNKNTGTEQLADVSSPDATSENDFARIPANNSISNTPRDVKSIIDSMGSYGQAIYGKNNLADFIEKQSELGNLRYINKEKNHLWSQSRGLQLPKLADTISDPTNNILQKQDIVNSESERSS